MPRGISAQNCCSPYAMPRQARLDECIMSQRTLLAWERGRREPRGAAKLLLTLATTHPAMVREAFGKEAQDEEPAWQKRSRRKVGCESSDAMPVNRDHLDLASAQP